MACDNLGVPGKNIFSTAPHFQDASGAIFVKQTAKTKSSNDIRGRFWPTLLKYYHDLSSSNQNNSFSN